MKLRTRGGSVTRGQAMTEYMSIVSTFFFLGGLAAFVGWDITKAFFDSLQIYIDLYFYALNLAIG